MQTGPCFRICMIAAVCSQLSFAVIASPSQLCDQAARYAANEIGVPLSILRALTLAETGRRPSRNEIFGPWPWSVHAGGQGYWFADETSAIRFVNQKIDDGLSNIDVGCFQLNVHWHAKGFRDIAAMMSPKENALYAARFVNSLYEETGDWRRAVGHYHSRTQSKAEGYVARLETLYYQHIGTQAPAPQPERANPPPVRQRQPHYDLVAARAPLIEIARRPRPLIGGLK